MNFISNICFDLSLSRTFINQPIYEAKTIEEHEIHMKTAFLLIFLFKWLNYTLGK